MLEHEQEDDREQRRREERDQRVRIGGAEISQHPQAFRLPAGLQVAEAKIVIHIIAEIPGERLGAAQRINGLRVVSRTAAFQFRGSGAVVKEIGRQFEVQALLEGSVRKSGDQLRVTVQLIDIASGFHRWSQRFDRKLEDVFTIQDAIASSVVASLRGTLLSEHEKEALQRPQTRPDRRVPPPGR